MAELNKERGGAPSHSADVGTSKFEPPRARQRLGLVLDLTSTLSADDGWGRTVVPADKEALADLMLDAFRDTVDYENETLADAVREIEHTMSGSYGRFLAGCSFVVAGAAGLASATLVTLPDQGTPGECPLLAFAFTRKRDQRRGLAAALIRRTAVALHEQGHRRLRLVVTCDNAPAHRLYDSLGFRRVD